MAQTVLIASSNSRFKHHSIFTAEDLSPFPGAYCYVTCRVLVGYSAPGDWRIEGVACETPSAVGLVEYPLPSPQAVFLVAAIDREFGQQIEDWVCERMDEHAEADKHYWTEAQIDDRIEARHSGRAAA